MYPCRFVFSNILFLAVRVELRIMEEGVTHYRHRGVERRILWEINDVPGEARVFYFFCHAFLGYRFSNIVFQKKNGLLNLCEVT